MPRRAATELLMPAFVVAFRISFVFPVTLVPFLLTIGTDRQPWRVESGPSSTECKDKLGAGRPGGRRPRRCRWKDTSDYDCNERPLERAASFCCWRHGSGRARRRGLAAYSGRRGTASRRRGMVQDASFLFQPGHVHPQQRAATTTATTTQQQERSCVAQWQQASLQLQTCSEDPARPRPGRTSSPPDSPSSVKECCPSVSPGTADTPREDSVKPETL